MKWKNKHNGKIAKVIKEKDGYIHFEIDGITTLLSKEKFKNNYGKEKRNS